MHFDLCLLLHNQIHKKEKQSDNAVIQKKLKGYTQSLSHSYKA